ncbi:MAG: hypothetical protein QS721_06835 [Candidatus Endonucleobacter sp. (ex Gigantidas childressi)]|nr:hypothetical protein [Candidatus Endonucleobacter sp. (ex Gigantidas childressi)]
MKKLTTRFMKNVISKIKYFTNLLAVLLVITGSILLSTVIYGSETIPVGPLKYTSHTIDITKSYPMHTLITNDINHLSFWLNKSDENKPILEVGAMARDKDTLDIGTISVNAAGNKSKLHQGDFLFFNPNHDGLRPFLASDAVFVKNIGFDIKALGGGVEGSVELTVGDLFKAMFAKGDDNQQQSAAVLSLVEHFQIEADQAVAILGNSDTLVRCSLSPFSYIDHYGAKGVIDEVYRLKVSVIWQSTDISSEDAFKSNPTFNEINTGAILVVGAPGCDIKRTEKRGWSISFKKDGTILRANVSPRTKRNYRFSNEQIDIYALLQLWKMPVASYDGHRMMSGTVFDERDNDYENNRGYVWAINQEINKKYIKKESPLSSYRASRVAEEQQHPGAYDAPYLAVNDIELEELEFYKDRVGLMSPERKLLLEIRKIIQDYKNDEL